MAAVAARRRGRLAGVRYVVIGAGAIGGLVGGRLAQHGHDVVLVARGDHGDTIRRSGLRIESPDDTVTVRVPCVGHPTEVGFTDDDAVLLATKSQDTLAAVSDLAGASPPEVPVVCFQNGVANEPTVLRWFARVQAAVVMCPAVHLSPGVVRAYSAPVSGLLDIGRYPDGTDEVTEGIVAALNDSSWNSVARPDVMRWKYGKLLLNLYNALDATTGFDDDVSDLLRRTRTEALACFEAAGIDAISSEEDRERRGDLLTMRSVSGEDHPGASSWQSLERGSGAIETDWLNGEIVLLGRLHGVPTPVNETLCRVADEMARAGAPPRSFPVDELRSRVAQAEAALNR